MSVIMNREKSENINNEGASVARKRPHVTVAPSPLNGVKLDLAIIIFLSVIIAVIVLNYFESTLTQLLYLSGYGLVSMFWLVIRTRRVMSDYQSRSRNQAHDEKTQ